jgi:uncharacterized protein YbaR (Trm112 family)/ubiquinone/menaquinone biosynthesis C-methylase UbiE
MKHRLLDLLVCPVCQSGLTLHGIEETGVRPDTKLSQSPVCSTQCAFGERYAEKKHHCHSCMVVGVQTGVLICTTNSAHIYPIINSIPRMLPAAMHTHAGEFTKHDMSRLPASIQTTIQLAIVNGDKHNGRFQHILESFSSEWKEVRDNTRAWGRNLPERRNLFFQCMNLTPDDLTDSILFDAGCGHGETMISLADTKAEIVGMDLSYSVDIVQRLVRRLPASQRKRIHLVQGNVCQPPFRNNVFDYVYSAGVLHHNPNTFDAFNSIARTVNSHGRIFIEVYSADHKNRIETIVWKATDVAKLITTHLPHKILHAVCYAQVPMYKAYHYIYNLSTGTKRYQKRSLREMELSIFDGLAPKYAWTHSTKEVANWFEKLGFRNLKKTFFNQNGIGIVGQMEKYATTINETVVEQTVTAFDVRNSR